MRRQTVTYGSGGARRRASTAGRAVSTAAAPLLVTALLLAAALFVAPQAGAQDLVNREAPPVGPERAAALFREGNDLYAQGDYSAAAQTYETILAGGFLNADVYYNLANARYMDGDVGQAVLGYERALRLDGSHEDAAANLEFVREQLADRQVRVGGVVSDAVEGFFRRAHTGLLAVVVSSLYFLAAACVVAGILRGAFRPWLLRVTVVALALLVVAGALLGYKIHRGSAVREAVIVVADVPVRTGPGDDFVLEFRLHEGTKVRLRETRDDWTRVSVEGTDLEGWMPGRMLEEI